ncbi:hypothetical protein AB3329_10905 [Streptococcus sp. H31]|uniref:hypothetical protein n=1 Tax=Streptococcus huangxiaojuni TaxID=3237239 RepID=UPI0034A46D0B
MSEKKRTLADVEQDEQKTAKSLENLEVDEKRLERFEEATENSFGETLAEFRWLGESPLSRQDRQDLDDMTLSYDHTKRFVSDDLADYHDKLKKQKVALEKEQDKLSEERQRLLAEEEKEKEKSDG